MSGRFRVGFDASAGDITAVTVLEEINGVWTVVDRTTIDLKPKESSMDRTPAEKILIEEFAGCVASGHRYKVVENPIQSAFTVIHLQQKEGGVLRTDVTIDRFYLISLPDPDHFIRQACRQLKERAHRGNLEPGQPDATWVLKMKELLDESP